MDQGLKERLVGAAVLVAIGVWLIPWVLDGPESPLDTGANSLQLPAAEEPMPMRTQTLRLGDDPEPEPAPAAAPEPAVAAAPPPAVSAPAPPAVAEPPAETPAPVVTAREPAPRPVASAATPPKPATAAAPPAAKGDWVVQLGSFGEEANARRLAQRVDGFGHKAVVSSVRSNGRTLYRVRVGPMATRGAADATASALLAHGVRPATVVAAD
jgi:DedD protein